MGSFRERGPILADGARAEFQMPCWLADDTMEALRLQVLVGRHRIEPGLAALVASLAFTGVAR